MTDKPDENDLSPPQATTGDKAHALTKVGLAAIPFVGGSAAELFQLVFAPPLKQRQQEWMEAIAEGLRRLEEKHKCVVEQLKDNDTFIDTVFQASQSAARTASKEKREALKKHLALARRPTEAYLRIARKVSKRGGDEINKFLRSFSQTPEGSQILGMIAKKG